MDLNEWVLADLVSARQRLAGGVINLIPVDKLTGEVDGGGIPPLYVLWHLSRHHDVAINAVLRNTEQVLDNWADDVGMTERFYRGLSEGSDVDLVETLDPEAVCAYTLATLDATIDWLETRPDFSTLSVAAPATRVLQNLGTPEDEFDWLYSMWDGKPRYWFLSWEGHGHVVTHTGELVSLRNRLGFSPF